MAHTTQDWLVFEHHLKDALEDDIDESGELLVPDLWQAKRPTQHTLDQLLEKIRALGEASPQSAIWRMESLNADRLEKIRKDREYWMGAAAHLEQTEDKTFKPSLAGKNMSPEQLLNRLNSYYARVESLAAQYATESVFKHAVTKYRKHILNVYGLGTPLWNRFHF